MGMRGRCLDLEIDFSLLRMPQHVWVMFGKCGVQLMEAGSATLAKARCAFRVVVGRTCA